MPLCNIVGIWGVLPAYRLVRVLGVRLYHTSFTACTLISALCWSVHDSNNYGNPTETVLTYEFCFFPGLCSKVLGPMQPKLGRWAMLWPTLIDFESNFFGQLL